VSFDQQGNAQLVFSIPRGELKGWHVVMIEPFLLSRPSQPRLNKAFKERRAKRASRGLPKANPGVIAGYIGIEV
jgi:hypothetical protein